MDREIFAERLHQASVKARDFARAYILENLPDDMLFRVRLNQSYDLNPLHPDERIYPDDRALNLTGKFARCTETEVVDLLWREGQVPEWVDLAAVAEAGSATIMQMTCCGRFTSNDQLLYHVKEGWPPFHAVGPALPPNYQKGEKFSIYTLCEAMNLTEVERLKLHRDKIRSLTLLGPQCNDSTLNGLPVFPALQGLGLRCTAITGSGLKALGSQPNLRVLNVWFGQNQPLELEGLPRLPSLNTLMVRHAASISLDFGNDFPKLDSLNHLDLESSDPLKLDGRLPDSMWALRLQGRNLTGTLTCCKKVEHLGLQLTEGSENEMSKFVRDTSGVKFLTVSKSPVSDTLMAQLVNRWPLEFLDIRGTKVTEEFVTRLTQLHPALRVVHNKGVTKSNPS